MNEEIKTTVLEIAKTYEKAQIDYVAQRKMLNQTTYDLKKRERQIASDVAGQKNPDGKDTFSSDVKRKAEVSARLDTDTDYQVFSNSHGSAEDSLADTQATLEVCKMNMKAYDIITR